MKKMEFQLYTLPGWKQIGYRRGGVKSVENLVRCNILVSIHAVFVKFLSVSESCVDSSALLIHSAQLGFVNLKCCSLKMFLELLLLVRVHKMKWKRKRKEKKWNETETEIINYITSPSVSLSVYERWTATLHAKADFAAFGVRCTVYQSLCTVGVRAYTHTHTKCFALVTYAWATAAASSS